MALWLSEFVEIPPTSAPVLLCWAVALLIGTCLAVAFDVVPKWRASLAISLALPLFLGAWRADLLAVVPSVGAWLMLLVAVAGLAWATAGLATTVSAIRYQRSPAAQRDRLMARARS